MYQQFQNEGLVFNGTSESTKLNNNSFSKKIKDNSALIINHSKWFESLKATTVET
jgi:hypothetical protein